MDPHDCHGIAAARTMLVLHAMRPRVRSADGTPGAARADLIDRPQWWCQLYPRVARCPHSRASGEAKASVADLQMG
jgi:hypothetical protein